MEILREILRVILGVGDPSKAEVIGVGRGEAVHREAPVFTNCCAFRVQHGSRICGRAVAIGAVLYHYRDLSILYIICGWDLGAQLRLAGGEACPRSVGMIQRVHLDGAAGRRSVPGQLHRIAVSQLPGLHLKTMVRRVIGNLCGQPVCPVRSLPAAYRVIAAAGKHRRGAVARRVGSADFKGQVGMIPIGIGNNGGEHRVRAVNLCLEIAENRVFLRRVEDDGFFRNIARRVGGCHRKFMISHGQRRCRSGIRQGNSLAIQFGCKGNRPVLAVNRRLDGKDALHSFAVCWAELHHRGRVVHRHCAGHGFSVYFRRQGVLPVAEFCRIPHSSLSVELFRRDGEDHIQPLLHTFRITDVVVFIRVQVVWLQDGTIRQCQIEILCLDIIVVFRGIRADRRQG